ncbi:helix-turn-helix domain-containing protein [Streptomyces sp. NPDC047515]|uniref:helix-turn-helix domain-containing protein n=1 Tax=Streptomyces sp. NPDC047515 TaxID=3155380 RepID=UPI0033FE0D8B
MPRGSSNASGGNMPRWKELPDSLDERVRRLVAQLRRLKDHSGLSLASLESRTGYSRSSWERYLNGRSLPPREAVDALAQVCGVDPTRLLALHEVAEEAWQSRGVPVTPDRSTGVRPDPRNQSGQSERTGEGTSAGRGIHKSVVLAVTAVLALGVPAAGLLITAPWDKEVRSGQKSDGPASGAFVYTPGKTYSCNVVRRKDGRLYAGYSTTRDELLVLTSGSWDVVEAQCLLHQHGFDPQGIDGKFGDRTRRAVVRFQKSTGDLAPDGKIGMNTWRQLRR